MTATYRFTFNEHDNAGGKGIEPRTMDLHGAPRRFIDAVTRALREDPFISDVCVTETVSVERVLSSDG